MNILTQDVDRDIVSMAETIDLSPDVSMVEAATRDLVPSLKSSADLVPVDEETDRVDLYRARLRKTAPRVAELADEVSRLFGNGTMAAVAPSLGLESQPLEAQRHVLFALSHLLGAPTATGPRDRRVLWDVKVRAATSGQFTTFSEDDSEAKLHTDNGFSADPEPIFFLYVVRAARCGGGMSYFANGWRIRDRLMQSSGGRDALALLRQAPVRFRVPPVFCHDADIPEYNAATVFAECPKMRFRQDVILRGLDANPAPGNNEIRDAVNLVTDAALAVRTTSRTLPTGSIAFVDNHDALHGRSRFSDAERHLIRVRIETRPLRH
ncbi:MAG: TauD/TfdA family dioxygenase [Rhodospirillales bacterium]|nr:TauD/TfdA family dioxygenase [Rhodospirillales bacterium]